MMDKSFTFLKGRKYLKSSPIFMVLGDLDELNATLGLTKAFATKNLQEKILYLQKDLREIGGFLAGVKKVDLKEKASCLTVKINQIADSSVKNFSYPGVNKTSAFLHLARAVCRRLERRVVGLKKKDFQEVVFYLNLLSSYLFWLTRKEEKAGY